MSEPDPGVVPVHAIADAWAQLGLFQRHGIGGAMGHAIHGRIVRDWVRAYLREHGRLPAGRRQVSGTYRTSRIRFETAFPGRASAALVVRGMTPAWEEVWGVPKGEEEGRFSRARREYRDSPQRARLRAWLLLQVEAALGDPASGAGGFPPVQR